MANTLDIEQPATAGYWLEEVYLSPTELDPAMSIGQLMNSTNSDALALGRVAEFLRWWHSDSMGGYNCDSNCRICRTVALLRTQALAAGREER